MVRTPVIISVAILVVFLYAPASSSKYNSQQNTPPVVTIVSPANNSTFTASTPVHYSITVSDKEDGDSKYEEINPKEVLLEVRYNENASTLSKELHETAQKDAPGLAAIRTSNCFNCHGFDTKVIGPTFTDINRRYKPTATNMTLLAKRIREGSKGIWGNVAMPTHPELTNDQIQNMVKWIMQNASGNTVHYYIGTEGSLNLKAPPGTSRNGAYILTASYTDHGINNTGQHLKGQDAIALRAR